MGKYRRYTDEQRLVILQEVEEHGLAVTLRKHSLYAKSIYQWRERLQAVSQHEARKRSAEELEIRRLQAEVQQLKEIVAEKEMALRIKDSLLKKTASRGRTD